MKLLPAAESHFYRQKIPKSSYKVKIMYGQNWLTADKC